MSLKDLTVDVVRNEIAQIIAKYPDRNGGLPEASVAYPEDKSCVYYLDQSGMAVTSDAEYYNESALLVTPVCLVGQWVEDFHPELKEDPVFGDILFRNAMVRSIPGDEFSLGVQEFLSEVQSAQDYYGVTWKDIDLDACGAERD